MTPGLWAGFFVAAIADDVVSGLRVSGDSVGGEVEAVSAGVVVNAAVCCVGFVATWALEVEGTSS